MLPDLLVIARKQIDGILWHRMWAKHDNISFSVCSSLFVNPMAGLPINHVLGVTHIRVNQEEERSRRRIFVNP